MSTHIATVRVERTLNRLYPVGSDTPLPDSAVVNLEADPLGNLPSRSNLRIGDTILDALGRTLVIDTRKDPGFGWMDVLHAYQADTLDDCTIADLEAPIVLLARNGEPIEGVMFQ
jgi:hypothetical protein